MSIQACADLVARGDPDRYRAVMAAPVEARRVLFPFYAFNLEVARAPWVTNEPLIAEMRLQWWADALEEIASGAPVRRHEVTDALAEVLVPSDASLLMANVDARRRYARREAFADAAALETYLADTSGKLLWAVTRALDPQVPAGAEQQAEAIGTALGLANYFLGVPEFLARGQNPLPDMSEAEFADLIRRNIAALSAPGATRAERIAQLSAWQAKPVLTKALMDPAAIPEGRLVPSPFSSAITLAWRRFRL